MRRSEAFRRAQEDRKRAKYRKVLRTENTKYIIHETPQQIEKRVAKMAITPHPNKCQCCCNPRHSTWYSGETRLTLQERRSKISEEEVLKTDLQS